MTNTVDGHIECIANKLKYMTIEIHKKKVYVVFWYSDLQLFQRKRNNNNLWQLVFLQNRNDYKMMLLNEIYIYIYWEIQNNHIMRNYTNIQSSYKTILKN